MCQFQSMGSHGRVGASGKNGRLFGPGPDVVICLFLGRALWLRPVAVGFVVNWGVEDGQKQPANAAFATRV